MADLITLAYATARLGKLSTAQINALPSAISAASEAVEDYCGRAFTAANYRQLFRTRGDQYLILPQYPVLQINRAATGVRPALTVRHATAPRASARLRQTSYRPDAIILTSVVGGIEDSLTYTFADFPTIGNLATEINSQGQGWTAQASTTYDDWASSDLADDATYPAGRGLQATFALFVDDWDYDYGHALESGILRVYDGTHLIDWRAGFDPIPGPVQEATLILTAAALTSPEAAKSFAAGISERSLEDYSVKFFQQGSAGPSLKPTLAQVSALASVYLDKYRRERLEWM